jgi:hypothetical protein
MVVNETRNESIILNHKNGCDSELVKLSLMILLFCFIVYSGLFNNSHIYASSDYKGEVFCARCHPEQFETWNQTAHLQAFNDPKFQEQWQAQGSPEACLTCHTTGFEVETGEFEFENVGCEICHGPGGEMNLNTSSSFCSRCHSFSHYPTYDEWLESEHSHAGIDCDSCHDPMSLEIKTIDHNDLCKTCHTEVAQEVLTNDHGAEDLECLDCHMIKKLADFNNGETGITGHTFYPGVPNPTCLGCHDVEMEKHDIWGIESENCVMCHDEVYMTRLHLLNGTDVVISDSSLICAQCHNEIYYELKMGIHSNTHEIDKTCTDCHSPMRPYILINETLPPITNVEQEIKVTGPLFSPLLFFMAVAVAISIAIYMFVFRRGP